MKQTTRKKYIYHVSHRYINSAGETICVETQLYDTGIYGIVNNDPSKQFAFDSPKIMVEIEDKLNKQLNEGKIRNLEFGKQIIVIEKDGFWKEVESQ